MNNKKVIRNSIKSILSSNSSGQFLTNAEDRIFCNPFSRGYSDECPLIMVQTGDENCELFDVSPRTFKRTLEIKIECIVSHSEDEDLSDKVDDLCSQVELIFQNNHDINQLVELIELKKIQTDISHEGNDPIAGAMLLYEVIYYTDETPVITLSNFETADQKIQTENNIIESLINIPQE
jgi:hypothetical protein